MSVGVVGAGITGLATVHHLQKRGVETACFEARSEPGGVIRSKRAGKRVLEAGPQRLRLTPGIEELIRDLGLWSELLVAPDDLPLYIYFDGKLREVPRSLRAFVRTDLLSARGKARVLTEPLVAPGKPTESVATLLSRKFGEEAYRNLVGPLLGGTYGSDPARMPARHALSGLLRMEAREGSLLKPALERVILGEAPPPISFSAGLATLPRTLYETHRERVHLSTPVTGLRRDRDDRDENEAEDGFVLETPENETRVDRVIVTTDAPTAARLLSGLDDDPAAFVGLSELRYNPLAVVHLDSDFSGTGFGYQIRWDEGFCTLGVTWNASLFDRERVYTAFLGGMKDPKTLDRSDERLGAVAAREFETVLGHSADALSVTRWEQGFPAYDASWDALDSLSVPEGVDLLTNYTARAGVAGRIRQAKAAAKRIANGRGSASGTRRTTRRSRSAG